MKTITFSARLLADAVISERSATTGGHRSLDYIPGATLLGAAASTLYAKLGDDAFTVFHSGKVRFGNAYPLTENGEPTLPIPLAWHAEKGAELNGRVTTVKTLLHATDDDFAAWDQQGIQQKQLRSGYFTRSGEKIDPDRNYRLKTAINREKHGMAEDAQLFGYQSLAAGSCWYFSLSCDADVPQTIIDQVTGALTGRIRVGRSRSAEYGLLATQIVDTPLETETTGAGGSLILYCAADLALADRATGCPVLTPNGSDFGLAKATLNLRKSYLRHRSYAPFNGKRLRFDQERQIIAKGSVLIFEQDGGFGAAELDALRRRLEPGIGLYRQDGLGQVIVNPLFLHHADFSPSSGPKLPVIAAPALGSVPQLAEWLTGKARERDEEIAAIALVDGWINDLVHSSCPKNSQWGQLRNIALQSRNMADLLARVTTLCTEGVSQKQWTNKLRVQGKQQEYRDFLVENVLDAKRVKIEDPRSKKDRYECHPNGNLTIEVVRKRLYLLGNRLPRKNNQRNGGDQ